MSWATVLAETARKPSIVTPGCRCYVDVRHAVLPFPYLRAMCVLAGGTLRERAEPAIRGTLIWALIRRVPTR